jgi:hypothetical protein
MQRRNLDSWKILIHKYLVTSGNQSNEEELVFMMKFTSQAIVNMTIEWAVNGMQIPVSLMARMDDVATEGIYGTITMTSNKP